MVSRQQIEEPWGIPGIKMAIVEIILCGCDERRSPLDYLEKDYTDWEEVNFSTVVNFSSVDLWSHVLFSTDLVSEAFDVLLTWQSEIQ